MILADFPVPQPDYSASPMVSAWVSGLVFLVVAVGLLIAWNQLRDADQRSRHETGEIWEKSKLAAELAKPVALIPVPDVEPEPVEPAPVVERRGKHRAEGESTDETRVFRVPPVLRVDAEQLTAVGAARLPLNTAHLPQRAGGSVRA